MKRLAFFIIICFFTANLISQNTVGLLSYKSYLSFEGYNLIYPHNQPNVYLLDNCGEVVHSWVDEANFRPGNTAYLTEEGLLYKTKRDASVAGDAIWAGGGGAILEIRDWDNNLIWNYELNDSIYRLHHDFAVTEEGNIIALAWELKNLEESIEAGKDTSTLAADEIWPDWIFEIDPNTSDIVWEWHAWDHLIQDFDDSKSNFGIVSENPGRIDINYYREDGHPDWMHANALDYNEELDQIMLSVPYFNELWIIDHTTSTEEAASNFGGFGNVGGDLMYRWGSPKAYQNGDESDQQLFFQHDTHWIDDHLSPAHPLYGKIAVFNNRVGTDYSTANILTPPWDMYEWKYTKENNVFGPEGFDRVIQHPVDSTQLFSSGLSSLQVLPNDNILITSGRFGYSFEVTPDNEIVWEYKTPLIGGAFATQGDSLSVNNNLTFRMDRYPIDFAAFDGKDLSPKGWLELEPNDEFCAALTNTEEQLDDKAFNIYPNPADQSLAIRWMGLNKANIEIFDLKGQQIEQIKNISGSKIYLGTSDWQNGIYFVTIKTEDAYYTRRLIIQH